MTDVVDDGLVRDLELRAENAEAERDALAGELAACRERIRRVEVVADEMLATANIEQDGTVRGFALRLRATLTAPASDAPATSEAPPPGKPRE